MSERIRPQEDVGDEIVSDSPDYGTQQRRRRAERFNNTESTSRAAEFFYSVGDKFQDIHDWRKNTAERFAGNVELARERAVDLGGKCLRGLENAGKVTLGAGVAAVEGVAGTVSRSVDSVRNRFYDGMDFIAGKVDNSVDFVADKLEQGKDFTKSVAEKSVENTKDFFEGIKNSLIEKKQAALNRKLSRLAERKQRADDRLAERMAQERKAAAEKRQQAETAQQELQARQAETLRAKAEAEELRRAEALAKRDEILERRQARRDRVTDFISGIKAEIKQRADDRLAEKIAQGREKAIAEREQAELKESDALLKQQERDRKDAEKVELKAGAKAMRQRKVESFVNAIENKAFEAQYAFVNTGSKITNWFGRFGDAWEGAKEGWHKRDSKIERSEDGSEKIEIVSA